MYHPTDRLVHTTPTVISVMEHWLQREIVQWLTHTHTHTHTHTYIYITELFSLVHMHSLLLNNGDNSHEHNNFSYPILENLTLLCAKAVR